MEQDIIKRLRGDGTSWAQPMFDEAADEIERLRALLARVQEYLYNPFEPDNQSALYKDVSAALSK